ncbi:hypothetical protein OE88DRAFT_1730626 [Heliocybe sulcata]|uniref:Uncharacterized protein n=1 Tax=Heliocybe sulcata TaxID=5364 RepID=A0A5C3NIL3_9AGAM|nr:hypothetical protein OE88DRAFT_1730626 [Heliocybe sulcata]
MYLQPRTDDNALCPPGHVACGPGIVISDHTPGETQDETSQSQVEDSPSEQSDQAVGGEQFGKRTYAGIAILAIIIVLGVIIYGIFGKWPRRKLRRWRKQRRARKHPPRRMKNQAVQTSGDQLEEKGEEVRGNEDVDVEELEKQSEPGWWATSPRTTTTEKTHRLSLALGSPSLHLWTEKSELADAGRAQASSQSTGARNETGEAPGYNVGSQQEDIVQSRD